MTHDSFTPHVLTILGNVSPARLSKAAEALANNDYTIRITHQTEVAISAFVTNGDGAQYGTTLTAHGPFCSCPDSMYRRVPCKHMAAMALYIIRSLKSPVEEGQPREERKPNLRLVQARSAWTASA